jgi:hypothetical protein
MPLRIESYTQNNNKKTYASKIYEENGKSQHTHKWIWI